MVCHVATLARERKLVSNQFRAFPWIVLLLFLANVSYSQDDPIIYVTKTGTKYHSAGCSYLKKSAIPMKLSEASVSYSPCSRCNPPTRSSRGKVSRHSLGEVTGVPSRPQGESSRSLIPSSDPPVGITPTGKTIYEGPRGGLYHYSKSGKKVYERKRK
jgi:hypothetical protein